MADKTTAVGDPFQEAATPQLPVAQTDFERLSSGSSSPMVNEALKRDYENRQAQANLYLKNASDLHGLKLHLADPKIRETAINPKTGQPYTQADLDEIDRQAEYAQGQYEKLVGVDKESKNALQKARGIIDFLHGRRKQMVAPPAGPNYPATVSDAGVSTESGGLVTPNYPTTISDSGGNVGGGVSYDQRRGGTLGPPPKAPLTMHDVISSSIAMPFATHGAKVQQGIADYNQGQAGMVSGRQGIVRKMVKDGTLSEEDASKPYIQDWILTGQINGRLMGKFQKTNMVDPETGMPAIFDPTGAGYINADGTEVRNPVPYEKGSVIAYKGPKGEPLFGIERYQKLYDQEGNQLPAGTEKFYPGLAEQDRWNITYKTVQQRDGSTALVPVLQRSGRTSPVGGPPTPGQSGPMAATPQGAGVTPSAQAPPVPASNRTPAKPSRGIPKVDQATAMGLPKGSIIAGGKVPPGVAKAYETYNGSAERYKIMQNAYAKVLESAKTGTIDQQAEINLLYNHIGMTTGLQKGGRITQDIIHEAQNSAPFVATLLEKIGIDNEFNISPTLLRGVTLTSDTMKNMVDLARDRTEQDRAAWEREVQAARAGYGMGAPMAPAPSTYTGGEGPTASGAKKPFREF